MTWIVLAAFFLLGGCALWSVINPSEELERFRDALERIALMDEADGYDIIGKRAEHIAFRATGLASQTLGKHPSEILIDREVRRGLKKLGGDGK